MNQVHEFLSRLGLVKGAAEFACRGYGVLFLHASHLHTHVTCLDNDHYSKWL